jgi:hypothetical protein
MKGEASVSAHKLSPSSAGKAGKKEEVASYDPNDMMSALAALKGKFKK